jgi:hypothetical protein
MLEVFRQEWNRPQQCSVSTKGRRAHTRFSPTRPCVLIYVLLDEWHDDISALHNASAEYDHLRIVGVNQRNRICRPYGQTVLLDCTGNCIFVSGCGEERLKIELRHIGQAGIVKSRCLSNYTWQ